MLRLQLFASLAPALVEIRAVALRNVAIKGVHSTRYLCMGADGRMRGLVGVTTGRDALGRTAAPDRACRVGVAVPWLPPLGPAWSSQWSSTKAG